MGRRGQVPVLLAVVTMLWAGAALDHPALAAAGSGGPPAVFVWGKEVSFPVPPVVTRDVTLVPVRALADSLGGHVEWKPWARDVTVRRAGRLLLLRPGDSALRVEFPYQAGAAYTVALPVAPRFVRGHLLAPLLDVAKALGLTEIAYREDGWHLADVTRRAALRVRSAPAGAWVHVGEGGASCLSPCTVGDLETGSHFVRVEAPGRERWAGEVPVQPGLNELAVTLVRGDRGRLTVLSEPWGDRVRLDGAEVGRTPLVNLPVAPGFHRLRVEGDGRAWEGTVRVLPADPSGGMVAGDLTTVVVNLAEGWVAVGYPAGVGRAGVRAFDGKGRLTGWTPDGRRLVLAGGEGLWLLDPEGLPDPEPLLPGARAWSFAGWSPDGRLLAYSDGSGMVIAEGGRERRHAWSELAVPADASGGGPRVLRWLPDGRLLGVVQGEWVTRYWVFDPRGGDRAASLTLPPSCPGEACGGLVFTLVDWLPDGRSVAEVRSYRRKDGTSEYTTAGYFADIGLVAPGGSTWRPLTEAAEGAYYEPLGFVPAAGGAGGAGRPPFLVAYRLWEPDRTPAGAGLAGQWRAYGVLPVEGGEGRLVLSPGEAAWASWSPNGDALLYGTRAGEVRVSGADGRGKRLLFRLPGAAGRVPAGEPRDFTPGRWSPRGDRFWIVDEAGRVWFLARWR